MRYQIPARELSLLKKEGHVFLIDFVSEEDIKILAHNADKRDSFQFCPLTKKILTNRALGTLLYDMIEQRPIKIVMSKNVKKGQIFSLKDVSIETVLIAIFIPFDGTPALFFTPGYLPEFECDGMVALYGDARARFAKKDGDDDASYLLRKGYAQGDMLKSSEYPLVFK